MDPFMRQLPHHHSLRRYPRVVRPWQVQRVVPAHPMPARQDVNFRVVQHVPDVQHPGHVRRRNHDGEYRPRCIRVGFEQRLIHPEVRPARLNLFRFVGFCDFPGHSAGFS